MNVADWLGSLGLERYEAAFRDNDVDAQMLPSLTAGDLKEIGIASLGHRRRLLEAIAALRIESTPAGDPIRFSSPSPIGPTQSSAEATGERRQLTVMF
jgi:SAM domain (Sterile alpha motif)